MLGSETDGTEGAAYIGAVGNEMLVGVGASPSKTGQLTFGESGIENPGSVGLKSGGVPITGVTVGISGG